MGPFPFETLEASFQLLCKGTRPLVLHGGPFGPPLPDRAIALSELRGMLLHPGTPAVCRQRVVAELVCRALDRGGDWTVGLAGVLLPRLTAEVVALCRARREEAADLQASVLAAMLEDLATCDRDDPRVGDRLVWSATRRAKRRLVSGLADAAGRVSDNLPAEPPRPWGHPDLVLIRAVASGVVTVDEADVIGETRLSGVSLRHYAASHAIALQTLSRHRARAEERLVAWLGADFSSEEWDKRHSARPYTGCGPLPARPTGRADGAISTHEPQEGGDGTPPLVSRSGGGPSKSVNAWRAEPQCTN